MPVYEASYYHTVTNNRHSTLTVSAPDEKSAQRLAKIKFANVNGVELDPAFYSIGLVEVPEETGDATVEEVATAAEPESETVAETPERSQEDQADYEAWVAAGKPLPLPVAPENQGDE